MRLLYTILALSAVILGSWWIWNTNHELRNFVSEYVDNGEFLTIQARYTADQIMTEHRNELLPDKEHSFQESELKFHPYLLMEVKYCKGDKKSCEGVLLWSQIDGEMVINTDNWEKTHGFEDAIKAEATKTDFTILNALAKNGGRLSKDQLIKELQMEANLLDPWIENLRKKHLIVLKGGNLQLHFHNPKIAVVPQTQITEWLVTKPYNHAQKVSGKYSRNQIEAIAYAAFGEDFTIRDVTQIYLPVYGIEVSNPDGSRLSTFWNALNGKRITPKYLADTK